MIVEGRHQATAQIARWFSYDHLPEGKPRYISKTCALMAQEMIRSLPDGPN